MELIWVKREGKYFCEWDWTGQIRLIRFNNLRIEGEGESFEKGLER